MRRRLSLTAALVLLLSLLCACAAQHAQEMDENGYELYFLSDPNSAGGGDAIHAQEKRLTLDGAMETEDCVRALMEALLAGPDEPSLSSPIPEGTALKSLKVSGRRAQIDLSAQYARLTGIDLSLADYCITLTLTQLPNVNAVSITADGRELPYRETQVLLSADTLLSSRESGLRPITVSLYFLDSKTGELRAEQQTLALYEGQTRVNALLEALAQGPEDDSLVSLLPEDFAVISSHRKRRVLSESPCERLTAGERGGARFDAERARAVHFVARRRGRGAVFDRRLGRARRLPVKKALRRNAEGLIISCAILRSLAREHRRADHARAVAERAELDARVRDGIARAKRTQVRCSM